MVIGGFDVTNQFIRARQAEPSEFEQGSFKTIRLAPGIKSIIGKKKGEDGTSIQSILFDKKKYTVESAKAWLAKHKEKFLDAVKLEEQKVALFDMNGECDCLEEHSIGHLPALSEEQLQKILEFVNYDPAAASDVTDEEDMPMEDYTSKFVKRI